jgi:hypothetical protein
VLNCNTAATMEGLERLAKNPFLLRYHLCTL